MRFHPNMICDLFLLLRVWVWITRGISEVWLLPCGACLSHVLPAKLCGALILGQLGIQKDSNEVIDEAVSSGSDGG
jgi:hypothetical protein